jgi:hypothetical protein
MSFYRRQLEFYQVKKANEYIDLFERKEESDEFLCND